ncbi:GNAT family N-acetyltransferase [Paenibacillus sp. NEAU-GSW1]|uniref:GNAT family N-acetyltransferase n=1 Tax=Paenibacillus sp. NEAU-GSW1 TaxID=2682486 RepID=UPI0012E2DBE5|nr:GNAT family N-acetyltransferase [Paenibacillus sp. NEAU-GSW1]MUT64599.1 GNAT family N-acetyltransferase [Paenibacillus sp. NEAU-GSW1]
MEKVYKQYVISDDKSRVDVEIVLDYLSRSYWASDRAEERIRKSIENSLCYGVYDGERQVAFARIVTDEATVYYVCDVFVLEAYQRQGIGKKLVETIVNSERFEGMKGLLGTRDAHGLYEQYGFEQVQGVYMRRRVQ